MALDYVIAELRAILQREQLERKRARYDREEAVLQIVRIDLETGDREQWLADTLETEAILG